MEEIKNRFQYRDTSNCFIYTGANNERWGIEHSFCIYYDATFSKLPTKNEDTGGDYSIPKANNSKYGLLSLKRREQRKQGGTMVRIEGTYYYAADVPNGYTQSYSPVSVEDR